MEWLKKEPLKWRSILLEANLLPTSLALDGSNFSFFLSFKFEFERKIIKLSCKICGLKEQHLQAKKIEDQVEEFDPIANTLRG